MLLVPPLAAPPTCFDLRRGCSLVEHLAAGGHRVYVVDYGAIGFGDRDLGLEHWICDVLPPAIRAVCEDAGEGLERFLTTHDRGHEARVTHLEVKRRRAASAG